MIIPEQLKNQRFILTRDKFPFQKQWQIVNNYEYDDNILNDYLAITPTYGVVAGVNNLVIVDFDNKEAQDNVMPFLPPTFTVKTATKGLNHLYYYTDELTTIRLKEPNPNKDKKKGKGIIDVQGTRTMVVGPNSILKSGKKYEIIEDIPIATIYKKELMEIILKNIKIPFEIEDKEGKELEKEQSNDLELFANPNILEIKRTLKISTLLASVNIPIHKNPTECPFHDSESKACLSYNDTTGLYNCFHPGCRGGDVLTLYGMIHNLDFKQTYNELYEKLVLKDKKYEEKLRNINEDVKSRKSKIINPEDIDRISKILITQFKFITIEQTEGIYYYNEEKGIYKPKGENIIGLELEKYFNGFSKTNIVNEITKKIMRLTHKPIDTFDQHKNLICLNNGVLDLNTKILLPHNSEYYFLNYIPVTYNVSATCPKFLKFASEIVHEEDYEAILELFGFVISKDYDLQKAILLVGGGANGKSVLLYVLKTMLGNDNVSAEGLHSICTELFSTAQLFGKLANISGDISNIPIIFTGKIKDLTSGSDTVSAQFKFQQKFYFVNNAKLLFGCNTVPASDDLTNGYIRRWFILKFPYTFEGDTDNKKLKYELTTEEELSGIFNIAIEKYHTLKKNGCFTGEKTVEETREEYINLSDPIQVFMDNFLIQDSTSYVLKSELYDKYNEFAKEHNIPKSSVKALTGLFKKKNLRADTIRVIVNNSPTTREAFRGINWKSNNDIIEF
jgi:putative DNA primase/helicase